MYGKEKVLTEGDVISLVRIAGKKMPIGRYLKSKIRKGVTGEEKISEEAMVQQAQEMRGMLQEAYGKEEYKNSSLARIYVDLKKGEIDSLEGKFKLKKEGSI